METINKIEETRRSLVSKGHTLVSLSEANPTLCGFHFPAEILKAAYADYFDQSIYRPDPKGLEVARIAIQNYYAEAHCNLSQDNIIITSGSSESFFYLFSLLCQPGDSVLAPVPSYPLFDSIASLAHIPLTPYQLDEAQNWQPNLDSIQKAIHSKVRAIILVSPHNPTGCVIEPERAQAIVDIANKHDLAIICDEVFSEFIFDGASYPRVAALTKPKLCFTLNGLSKMMALPAFKLSWIAITGEQNRVHQALDRLEHMSDTFLTCHSAIQSALPVILDQGRPFLAEYKKAVETRKQLALTILTESPEIKIIEPKGGFYLALKFQHPDLDDEALALKCLTQKQLYVHPGYFYDFQDDHYLALSFLHKPEILQTALRSLLEILKT